MEYGQNWIQENSQTQSSKIKSLEVLGSGHGHNVVRHIPHAPNSRPSSSHRPTSRPRSGKRRKDLFRAAEDPDYEDIETILSQMEHCNQPTREIPMYTECQCGPQPQPKIVDNRSSPEPTVESYGDIDSASDTDDDVELPVVLSLLQKLKNNALRRTSNKAFLTLVAGLDTGLKIGKDQVKEILSYLDKETIVEIQDLALRLIKQLCFNKENVEMFLTNNLMKVLEKVLLSMRPLMPYVAAVGVLEMIVSHEVLMSVWLDYVMLVFPGLLRHLQIEETVDAKYDICCLFRGLAKYPELSWNIQNEAIPVIDVTRGNSTKMSEMYTQVMMEAVQHSEEVSVGLIQNGALPTATKILQEGPCGAQKHALALLEALSRKDIGISYIIDDEDILTLVLRCIKESKCRHVRAEAIGVLANTFVTRSRGRCKDLMTHIADYLVPATLEIELLQAFSLAGGEEKMPLIRNKHERETQLWKGLDNLCHLMCDIICKEAKVEVGADGDVQKIGLTASSTSNVCSPGVVGVANCVRVLTNVCLWAASKSRHDFYKIDIDQFSYSETQRLKLSKLNRVLTHAIWNIAGRVITAILAQFSSQLRRLLVLADLLYDRKMRVKEELSGTVVKKGTSQRSLVEKSLLRNGNLDLLKIFYAEEVNLIHVCLEFLLCVSLLTCKEFPDLVKHQTPPGSGNNRNSKNGTPTGSHGNTPNGSDGKDNGRVSSNIDQSRHNCNKSETEKSSEHKANKEDGDQALASDRRQFRRYLYEAGVFYCVAPLLSSSDYTCQVLACQILRCNVQPLEEKLLFQSAKSKRRPHSAVNRREMEKKLNVALHQMSPDFAVIVREAIGPRPVSAHPSSGSGDTDETLTVSSTSGEGIEDPEAAARLAEYIEQTKKTEKIKKTVDFGVPLIGPVLDPRQAMVQQCRQTLVKECGYRLLSVIFTAPKPNRKHLISLIYDVIHFGDHEIHMKLAEFGCMQKLLDFLRVNTDNELLEIIGLIIVQMLLKSDPRLRQIFDRHGGMRLMMTMMSKYSSGGLREEIKKTMRTVSSTGITAAPAPKPVEKSNLPPDVWDTIQSRWKVEDKVKTVLRNWRSDV